MPITTPPLQNYAPVFKPASLGPKRMGNSLRNLSLVNYNYSGHFVPLLCLVDLQYQKKKGLVKIIVDNNN